MADADTSSAGDIHVMLGSSGRTATLTLTMKALVSVWTALLCVTSLADETQALTVVDMTHTLGNDTVFWPGNPQFKFDILARGNQSGGYWYESNSFFTAEHGGTHVDAPAHFSQSRWRVDDIPVSHLVGPAAVLDVKAEASADPDYLLTVQDIEDWEAQHGKIPDKGVVLMNSGWGARYPHPSSVFNTSTPTDPSTFHFPGIHPAAAAFLTGQRDVIAVGVDTPSTDRGQSTTFGTHVVLGEHNVLGLENLANLDDLPSRGATVVIGLVKLRDGSGGPARIMGIVGDGFGDGTGGGAAVAPARLWVWAMMFVVACVV